MALRITTSSNRSTRIRRFVPNDSDGSSLTVGAIVREMRSEEKSEDEDEARNSDEKKKGEKEEGGSARVEWRSGGMARVKKLGR